MATWTRSTCQSRRVYALTVTLLVLAALVAGGGPGPGIAEASDPAPRVWRIDSGEAGQIQAAINAARDAGGGVVYLPAGVYALTAKLRVHSNVTIVGDGLDKTILRWAPGVERDHMMSNGSLTDGNVNIQIRDLMLDGQGAPVGRPDCCFGLRLANVRDSFVINVGAVGHSKDGIYLGYAGSGGAVNVRVSGCLVGVNGRNGIALVGGDGVTIDHCHIENNNLADKVAGIDVEPDEGLSVTNTKLIANDIDGQDVGIKLHVPSSDYATVAQTAVCQNALHDNRLANVLDHYTVQTIYVANAGIGSRANVQAGTTAPSDVNGDGICELPPLPEAPSLP